MFRFDDIIFSFKNIISFLAVIECPDPNNNTGTELTSGGSSPFLVNNITTYDCSVGWEYVSGDRIIMCLLNKTWNGSVPQCQSKEKGKERINCLMFRGLSSINPFFKCYFFVKGHLYYKHRAPQMMSAYKEMK